MGQINSAVHPQSIDPSLVSKLIKESNADVAAFSPDSVLIEIGATSSPLFLVEKGSLEIISKEGSRLMLDAPTIVGEQSLLTGKKTNSKVVVKKEVYARAIEAKQFWEIIKSSILGPSLIQALVKLNSERLKGKFHPKPYIALIAHDGRKDDLVSTSKEFLPYLKEQPLLSTQHTGEKMEKELALSISRVVHSGPKGGDQEVGTLVVEGLVNAVFFFPDPLTSQPHFMDVGALQRVCDVCHVPIATNKGSAFHLFNSLSK